MSLTKLTTAVAGAVTALAAVSASAQPVPPIGLPGDQPTVPGGTTGCNGKPCPGTPGTPDKPTHTWGQKQHQSQSLALINRYKAAANSTNSVMITPRCADGVQIGVGTVPVTGHIGFVKTNLKCGLVEAGTFVAVAAIQVRNIAALGTALNIIASVDVDAEASLLKSARGMATCGNNDLAGTISGGQYCAGPVRASASYYEEGYYNGRSGRGGGSGRSKQKVQKAPTEQPCIDPARICPVSKTKTSAFTPK